MTGTHPAMPPPEMVRADTTDPPVGTATSTGEPRLAFSPDETAQLLGVSPELVFDLLRSGQLKSVKAGRRRLISRANIDAFLAGDAA
jgi:excisionase family DNA binding protein